MADPLLDFHRDLLQDVLATAEAVDSTAPEAFTQRMIEHLVDAGEFNEALAIYHRGRGTEVSGYGVDEDAGRLDLLISQFEQSPEPVSIPPSGVEALVRRAAGFATQCQNDLKSRVDDSAAAWDMVCDVSDVLTRQQPVTRLRIFVLTNATSRAREIEAPAIQGVETSVHVWDLQRLHRLATSGQLHEPIVIDFPARFGTSLSCLATPTTDTDYDVLLSIIPGHMLAELYGEYGTRLLELNVRSFLQAKGSVNGGIRATLANEPARFLAYNNGISATASKVETGPAVDGGTGVLRLHDLQIVNGGQTTASIHAAAQRGVDLSQVLVQAKITVVAPSNIEQIVPAISRFSNTQNKVTTADFSSNEPYHVGLEKLSRAVWAPSPRGGGQETHWFYERARGQYADELARQRTPARQRAWKVNNPTRQKFTKTDLAKYVSTWGDQLPHMVSRGAEKNFREFMVRLVKDGRPIVDESHFRQVVAQAILFRQTERIVQAKAFGGYRANIVTYTLAKLSKSTAQRVDLDAIWKAQGLSPVLEEAIGELCSLVQKSLTTPPGSANVSEWCKRPEAWARVEDIKWDTPPELDCELVDAREQRRRAARAAAGATAAEGSDAYVQVDVARVTAVPAETWDEVAAWAKQSGELKIWQRGFAVNLANLARRGTPPSGTQVSQAVELLDAALAAGYAPTSPLPTSWMT